MTEAGFDAPDRGIDASAILAKLKANTNVEVVSCQRVVTKSGENCVIKSVTECIYPQDFDVMLPDVMSSPSPNDPSNETQRTSSAVLAVAEPQNFTMREVGMFLDVEPTVDHYPWSRYPQDKNDFQISLAVKPSVVEPPVWKDYGMRLPFAVAGQKQDKSADVVYYDLKMEQPFFAARSVDTKLTMKAETTVALSVGASNDGKDGRMGVFFLTARVQEVDKPKP